MSFSHPLSLTLGCFLSFVVDMTSSSLTSHPGGQLFQCWASFMILNFWGISFPSSLCRFFAGQELIDFKMQEVVFVDEQERSMMDHLTTLRTKLDVEDLPPHHLERIRMEVDLDGARQLRRLANTCASFISGMGRMHSGSGLGTFGLYVRSPYDLWRLGFQILCFLVPFILGDMSMKGYLMDILRMEHNMEVMELQSVGDSVLLKHIPSLIGMLEQLLASNPMEDISPAFKAALPVSGCNSNNPRGVMSLNDLVLLATPPSLPLKPGGIDGATEAVSPPHERACPAGCPAKSWSPVPGPCQRQ